MNKILSPQLREALLLRHQTERDGRLRHRLKVVLWYDEGWTKRAIARALFIAEETVQEHLVIYDQEVRLKGDHHGSNPTLDDTESQALTEHLESKLYTTVKQIRFYIESTFQKLLSQSSTYEWLKSHGFTYKKPKIIPKHADVLQQDAFRARYHQLMNQATLEQEPVLFADSVHPSQQIRAAYGWMRRGKCPPIASTSARKRVNLMGSINLETMEFVYQDFETINGDSAVAFLQKVEAFYPHARKIHVIWDQAGYHTSGAVEIFLRTSRVKVTYLLSRSPNLNPIERL